ncbi:MAG TPA: phosphatidate cytidylyltransferase [Actinomycetota bacterium]|nr:phosphatidate cytidylyltransferase [Actinomycetota bacterium]
MADREGRGESGEDLFEDLDKFFAPIQDVDWPEGHERERAPAAEPEPAEPEAQLEETEAGEPFAEESRPEPEAEPEPAMSIWSQEQGTAEDEEHDEGGGVTSFLFESEAEDTEPELTEEAFTRPPSDYVDLPGPKDEGGVAELDEGDDRTVEERPDLETVEAAADHFAESVREEVRVEAESGEGATTEEVQIAALLGTDEEEDARPAEAFEPEPARTVRVGQEGLGGPSWQEPTALEVGVEPERGGPGRDVPMAFLTGLVLAGLAVGAILIGPGPFAILVGLVVLVAQGELYFALQKRHFQPATALGLVSGGLVLAAAYYRGPSAMLAMVALGTFATFLWYLAVPPQHRRNVTANIGLTVLGIAYIPTLAGYILFILRFPDGRSLVLAILGLTIVYDIAAFGVGYFWGSRPLAPHVSPKKSWEGAIGATLVVLAVAVGAVAAAVELLDTVPRSVVLAVVVAVFAPLGDLAESLIKRDLGIKDMGSILPGHGGVLDRIDAMLFVAPAAALYLQLIL